VTPQRQVALQSKQLRRSDESGVVSVSEYRIRAGGGRVVEAWEDAMKDKSPDGRLMIASACTPMRSGKF
jgi:hypothetical protein